MMLLSRFWYAVLAFGFAAALFLLFVATRVTSRSNERSMGESLIADASAVDWFLRDDARRRSSALIPFTLSPEIVAGLAKASSDTPLPRDVRSKTSSALRKLAEETPAELKFDALWAVDANGRVIASSGFEHVEDWDLGGYASVADALHGWIRDDAWVWKGLIYRIVMRPVEREAGSDPVGAIVGAKIVDDVFAKSVSRRTGAAVGFFANGARVAAAAPEGFDKANLDPISRELPLLGDSKDYQEKGRSEVRTIGEHVGVVFSRMPGETWELGAGYAVGQLATTVSSPLDFWSLAEVGDKEHVPTKGILALLAALAAVGIGLTFLEHTRPLSVFRAEIARLAKGEIVVLQPAKFQGPYKKLALDINEGIDMAASKGGVSRKAADFERVLGPMPAKPQMSAFSVPGAGTPPPKAADVPERLPAPERPTIPKPPPPAIKPSPAEDEARVESISLGVPDEPAAVDELAEWRGIYDEFVALKKECGEPLAGLTFEKFRGTLQRNKAALVARHNCARVKFTVYVKEGKAALKASPVK